MTFAAGYQHFADGAPFGDIVLAHPAVKEVYFPWPDEPSGRPVLGYEEEDDPEVLMDCLLFDLQRLRNHNVYIVLSRDNKGHICVVAAGISEHINVRFVSADPKAGKIFRKQGKLC